MKASRHQSNGCEVCEKQLSKLNQKFGKSEESLTMNKILQRYRFPEVIHEGIICHGCKMEPIKGSKFFCLICSSLKFCEFCGESVTHDHPLLFTSSKCDIIYCFIAVCGC